MEILRTARTVVRDLSLKDAPFFLQLLNTPKWLQFIGDRQVHSIEEAEQYLEKGLLRSAQTNGFAYYLVQTSELKPIGICGFLKKPHLENPDFGFAQIPEYFGQGLAREYAQAILRYGIETFQFSLIDAEVDEANDRSIRLLTWLGFSKATTRWNEGHTTEIYRWKAPTVPSSSP